MEKKQFEKAFKNWKKAVDGVYLDLDGFPPEQPYQCHDVWLSYITYIFGLTIRDGYAPGSGYTDQVFKQFPFTKALDTHFNKHVGVGGVKAGDVLFWAYGDPVYPYSHVAIALGPAKNGYILTMTQNPGKTRIESLPISNLLGYLRPDVVDTPKKKETIVISKQYNPKDTNRQTFQPGDYRMVGISDPNAQKSRATSIATGLGAKLVYGQLNVIGPKGTDVEVALAIDTVDAKTGARIGQPRFVGAESGTIGDGALKIGLTVPLTLTKAKAGQAHRVRIYVKPTRQPVSTSFVRWATADI